MSRISNHKKRRIELLRLIKVCQGYKSSVERSLHHLNKHHEHGLLGVQEYYREIHEKYEGKHPDDLIAYYDQCIGYYRHKLAFCERAIRKERNKVSISIALVVALLMMLGIGVFVFNPEFVGMTVYESPNIVNDTLEFNLTGISFEPSESNVTAMLNSQSATLSLSEFALQDGTVLVDLSRFNIMAEDGKLVVQITYNDSIIAESSLDISVAPEAVENITLPEENITAPESNITLPVENLTMPDENVTVPENLTLPGENITLPGFDIAKLKEKIKSKRHSDYVDVLNVSLRDKKYALDLEFNKQGKFKGRAKLEGVDELANLDAVQFDSLSDNKIPHGLIRTDVIAISNITLANATITLKKNGDVNTIMKCSNWDYDNFLCNEWTDSGLPFEDDGENITFEVSGFSAYAGVELTILNVQSYPVVGGDWTVMFTTAGTADLTIRTVDGTTWSGSNDNEDLRFVEVRCGNEAKSYQWTDGKVFISNYSCADVGYEVSHVLTPGKHHLEFTFGDITRYANNDGAYVLFLNNTNTANMSGTPCPTNHMQLNTGAVTGTWTVREPGEFDDGTNVGPGNSDFGVWNSTGANIGNTTIAKEIANPAQASRTTASIGEGWLWAGNIATMGLLTNDNLTFNLNILGCQGAVTVLERFAVRASVVTCSGGVMTWKRDLFGTQLTGEVSHTGGQEGWRNSDSRMNHSAVRAYATKTFNIATNDTYVFVEGDMLLFEFGFGDADSTTDRTACLRYNYADTNITFTLRSFDIDAPVVTPTDPADNEYNDTTNTVDFNYTVSDYSDINNCSLIIQHDDSITVNFTDTSNVTKTITNNLTVYLPNADYNWSVNCTDSSNNIGASETRNLSVNVLAPSLENLNVDPKKVLNGTAINITADITTTVGTLTQTTAMLYYPNGSYFENRTLSQVGTTDTYYNDTYIVDFDAAAGTYTVTIHAENSLGMINDSEQATFNPYLFLGDEENIDIDGSFTDWETVQNVSEASASSDTYYNFNGIDSPTQTHNATSCSSCLSLRPPSTLGITGETEFNQTSSSSGLNYTNIAENDGLYGTADSVFNYAFQKFTFVIDENEEDINNLTTSIAARGRDPGPAGLGGFFLFIWNTTSSSWSKLYSYGDEPWKNLNFSFTNSTEIIDDNKKLYLLIESYDMGSITLYEPNIDVDFVDVEVSVGDANVDIRTVSLANNNTNLFALIEVGGVLEFVVDKYYRFFISTNDDNGVQTTPDTGTLLPFNYSYLANITNGNCELYDNNNASLGNCYLSTSTNTLEIGIPLNLMTEVSPGTNLNITFETGSTTQSYDFAPNQQSFISYTIVSEQPDVTAPTITLEAPDDNGTNTTANTIDFTYNLSDASALANCTLIIQHDADTTINVTDTAMLKDRAGQNLTTYLPNSDYNWSVNCTDNSNNIGASEVRNISINYVAANNPPIIFEIFIPFAVDPVDGSDVNVSFSFLADDQGGINEFDNSSANATLTLNTACGPGGPGLGMQLNDTLCDAADTGNNATVQNYTCAITMRYFDCAADWSVNVTVSDNAPSQANTTNVTFTYNSLTAINMTPSLMSWGQLTVTSLDQLSTSNPIIVGNTGNYNITSVNLSAINLGGEQTGSEFITANNFSVNTANACNSGHFLQNNTLGDIVIPGAGIASGLEKGEQASDELLYLCLEELPQSISQQSYSTVNVGAWNIGVS